MIAKISSSANLAGALGYNFKKVNTGGASVLLAEGLYENPDSAYTLLEVLSDMLAFIPPECRTKNLVFHCSLNPHPKEKLTDEDLIRIAREYVQALGYGLLDSEGKQVPFGAKGLQVLDRITDEKVIPELADCTFRVACDVTNTLCGDQGCSAVFGPQKGADPGMIMQMDKWLAYYAALAREKYEKANPRQAGTGAAGGDESRGTSQAL